MTLDPKAKGRKQSCSARPKWRDHAGAVQPPRDEAAEDRGPEQLGSRLQAPALQSTWARRALRTEGAPPLLPLLPPRMLDWGGGRFAAAAPVQISSFGVKSRNLTAEKNIVRPAITNIEDRRRRTRMAANEDAKRARLLRPCAKPPGGHETREGCAETSAGTLCEHAC